MLHHTMLPSTFSLYRTSTRYKHRDYETCVCLNKGYIEIVGLVLSHRFVIINEVWKHLILTCESYKKNNLFSKNKNIIMDETPYLQWTSWLRSCSINFSFASLSIASRYAFIMSWFWQANNSVVNSSRLLIWASSVLRVSANEFTWRVRR